MGDLWDLWQPGTVVLATQARLARMLRTAYDERQRAAGRLSWPTAPVSTWDHWLQSLWSSCGDRLLLSAAQEHWLWHEIIAANPGATALLDEEAAAEAATTAWRWAQHWQLPWEQQRWDAREETAAFNGWAGELRHRLAAHGWITGAQLPEAITAAVRAGTLAPPAGLLPADEAELPPQWRQLLADLQTAGTRLLPGAPAAAAAAVSVSSYADPSRELEAAAGWARFLIEQGDAGPVGVIVPLAGRRAQVERIFLTVLHPGRAPWDSTPRAFHLSLGEPLEQAPAIAAALAWIALLRDAGAQAPPLETERLLAALGSPFVAAAESEAGPRAQLVRQMRRRQQSAWRWTTLERLAARDCPVLAARLRQARRLRLAWPARQSHTGWIASFAAALEALGWPGERPLDSSGFQLQHAWELLLDGLERLDQTSGTAVDAGTMLARLRHGARNRIFQPEAAPAPVQVLGWLEATGIEFTHLWVTGMDDQALPAAPHPHPFLPWEWQREAGLPQASAERSAEVSQRRWQALLRHSGAVIASYAGKDAREQPLRPSPLLGDCEMQAPLPVETPRPAERAPMEFLEDAEAPPAGAGERSGGSDLLRDQSDCPFRAFVHYRLHARRPPEAAPGLAATTRGSLLHRLLAQLWRRLQSSAQLPAASDAALQATIATLAAEVTAAESALDGQPGLAGVEAARLAAVATDWLECERQRRPFHVLDLENRSSVAFAGLDLTLQRDRVDELDGGAHAGERVLLDYKSGATSVALWAEPRPPQPQLPLYLLTEAGPPRVAAMAFAQVRTGGMGFVGLERAPGLLVSEPLQSDASRLLSDEQIARWRVALEALAAEYLRGAAGVLPRDENCCQYCDLTALCRIRENHGERGDEEPPLG